MQNISSITLSVTQQSRLRVQQLPVISKRLPHTETPVKS